MTHAVDSLTMTEVNLETSHSVLTDTNYAEETSKLAAASIINQAATNVLEQTHEASKRVLTNVIRSTDSSKDQNLLALPLEQLFPTQSLWVRYSYAFSAVRDDLHHAVRRLEA